MTPRTTRRSEIGKFLEDGDELGVAWDDMADGRVWRLKRGEHFLRSSHAVQDAAQSAATRLGKAVRTVRQARDRSVSIWVQFADYQIEIGEPCGCGSTALQLVNRGFALCEECGSSLLLIVPKPGRAPKVSAAKRAARKEARAAVVAPATAEEVIREEIPPEQAADVPAETAPEPAAEAPPEEAEPTEPLATAADPPVTAVEAAPPVPTPAKLARKTEKSRQKRRKEKGLQLTDFTDVELYRYATLPNRERFYGYGVSFKGHHCLLLVDYPLDEHGNRVSEPDESGEQHSVLAIPSEPFGEAVDFSAIGDEQRLTG